MASVESLVLRPVAREQLNTASRDSLFQIDWIPVRPSGETEVVAVRCPRTDSVREALTEVLERLRSWLAEERDDATRLAVVTRGAVAVGDEDGPRDLAQAAVWGLVRSAQSEHPGRFLLVDVDDPDAEPPASDEPQLALRAGRAFAPRLTRSVPPPAEEAVLDPAGTVLITGGSGTLAGLVARHLVTAHGVGRVVLASRSGAIPEAASDLAAEVLGVACDVADREAVARLLAEIPERHPLTAVVHTAGVLDDGVIESLTADRIDRVLRPKVDGARNLHELTEHLDLAAFVLFSSGATTFGAPGQGNYAAANAYLDALAQRRRRAGLPAVSLAWGLWAERSGLTGDLSEGDLARMARSGSAAMATEEALALFDAALRAEPAVLVPVHLDNATLRAQAESGTLPAILRGLVRTPIRRSAEVAGESGFAELSEADRERKLLALVRGHAAEVLGHDTDAAVEPDRAFKELGFDSLTAVELRNRLTAATGLRLRATLVFDHPTPAALAARLAGQFGGGTESDAEAVLAEIERMDDLLAAMDEDDRGRIAVRLRALLVKSGADPGGEADAGTRLRSATDEEMFAFIDQELGS
ncbi:SDR family NAD(P)-dependent oxidoreductase [Amycolatopsis anabasis]|uniref:type I polyketide synthase n=1 Tax=Amycolatopsis anabasis TaxID=1840409 RepID=UPI003CCD257D